VTHNLFVGYDRHVYQRKSTAVEFSCQRRVIKLLQPVGGIRIRAAFAGIEQDGDVPESGSVKLAKELGNMRGIDWNSP
jgi:hypothetical protein